MGRSRTVIDDVEALGVAPKLATSNFLKVPGRAGVSAKYKPIGLYANASLRIS